MGTEVNYFERPLLLGDSKFYYIALNNKKTIHQLKSKSINHRTTKVSEIISIREQMTNFIVVLLKMKNKSCFN